MSSPSETIGFAIVGTGVIAGFHARAIAATPGAELRAVYNRSAERARGFAMEFGGEVCADLDALLARPDVSVVCVTMPSGAHGEVAMNALRAGKHVLCEKPLEITTQRIDAMIKTAAESRRILAAVFQYRFGAAAGHLKAAMAAGRFGRLSLCSAYIKWWRDPSYYSTSTWKGTAALDGGGALMNQAIHAVDLLQWLVGMPVSVSARVRTLVHHIEMEDTVSANLEFADGALGVIEAATSCYPGMPLRIEISGGKGTAILENDQLLKWEFAEAAPDDERIRTARGTSIGGGASDPKAISIEGHSRLVADLRRAIVSNTTPAIPASEARNAVAVIQAVYRSNRENRPCVPE